MDISHIPVERLREPMPRWAGDIIRQQRARIERLEAAVKAADVLRARWLNDGHGLAEKWQTEFREAREAYDRARAALARKEGT